MKVKRLMHKSAATVEPTAGLAAIAKMMRKLDIGAMPVKENGELIGMVTDRDIACRGLGNGRDFSELVARDVMTKKVVSCKVDDDVDDAVKLMRTKKIRRLAVLDTKGKLAGMLSLGDLCQKVKPKQSRQLLRAVAAHHA